MLRFKSKNQKKRVPTGGTGEWYVARVFDERTANSMLAFEFPRHLGDRGFEYLDDDLSEKPTEIRRKLKNRGARFTGTKEEQERFIERLMGNMRPGTKILTDKPGFRNDGFVLGRNLLGGANIRYLWRGTDDVFEVGRSAGTIEGWKRDVGKVATFSSYASAAILIGLAACLPGYFRSRRASSPGQRIQLLSETGVFNFSGESGSGRTEISRACAGLFGSADAISKWDFTRRGLEERAEARNDLVLVLDDTEKHTGEDMSLKTALRLVNQVIASGQSKAVSKIAKNNDLPFLLWTTFGVSSSPQSLEKLALGVGCKRSNGERVRFIDIPVPPPANAGIFDRLEGSASERVNEGKALISQFQAGIDSNFGVVHPAWIEFLLAEDRTERVELFIDLFGKKVAPYGDGWDERLAKKFGLLYAAGRLAIEAGVLPWPRDLPMKAVSRCYRRALKGIRIDEDEARKKLRTLAGLQSDPTKFPVVRLGSVNRFWDGKALGIRTTVKGASVCAIRDETLRSFAGDHGVTRKMIDLLVAKGAIAGSQGHARTMQLPIQMVVSGQATARPRFWVIHANALKAIAAS